MPSDSTLTLFIPDLFGFQSTFSTLSSSEISQLPELKLPVLEKWLSRGEVKPSLPQDDIIFNEFGLVIDKNKDKPYAALSLYAEKVADVDNKINTDSYWFRADPVNVQADRDTALLVAHEEIALTQEEANQLVKEINQHFIDEPWKLFSFAPHRWYLRTDEYTNINTHSLFKVHGGYVDEYAISGEDERYWFNILNEIQMLLHGSVVNFERDSRNQLTANSLWLWGGGSLPDNPLNAIYDNMMTNDMIFSGLGAYCGFDVFDLSEGFNNKIHDGNNFVVLDMLSKYVQQRDLYSFVQMLNEMEEQFFSRCNDLLKNGKVQEIKILTDKIAIIVTKKSLARWWKRTKSFTGFKNA